MKRKEEIENAAARFDGSMDCVGCFIGGANWADEHPRQLIMSAADRGIIDEIVLALRTLGSEKMISYDREINWLNELRKL